MSDNNSNLIVINKDKLYMVLRNSLSRELACNIINELRICDFELLNA